MDDLYPNEAEVTDADKKALRAALLHAYPDISFLYLRLRDRWGGFRAGDWLDLGRGKILIIADIVDLAASQGKVLDLLAVTWADKPLNPQLKPLAERLLRDPAAVVAHYAPSAIDQVTGAPARRSLEKMVEKRSKLLNLAGFVRRAQQLSGALCRISLKPATGFEAKGTGFLIGRRHVLTNYHVMQTALTGQFDAQRVRLEFDFAEQGGTTTEIAVAPGISWNVSRSPFSHSDLTGVGEPAPGELDYCLVKLAENVPANRLHLALPDAPPIVSERDFIAIGQHPQGSEANIAFGEVLAYPGSGLRYRYDVTTEPGSSGSPVLTLDLNLVGLHHAGDPQYVPKYNQGVPIWLILRAIADGGQKLEEL